MQSRIRAPRGSACRRAGANALNPAAPATALRALNNSTTLVQADTGLDNSSAIVEADTGLTEYSDNLYARTMIGYFTKKMSAVVGARNFTLFSP